MILRLSEKLKTKIKAGPLQTLPLEDNPFADWSAHLFVAGRTQYILFCNTKSFYSTVFYAQGITHESHFITRCFDSLRKFMESDKRLDVYDQFIAPTARSVTFAKSLNRKISGSITELEKSAKILLAEKDLSPHQVCFHLNDILLSAIAINPKDRYSKPNEAFQLIVDCVSDRSDLSQNPIQCMKRPLPRTKASWFKEIRLAIADASEAIAFGDAIGESINDANLFHLAPHVCLKFRGLKSKGPEAERVIEVALANYVVNSDSDGIDHGLEQRPLMAFTLCYVAAHLALDLLDEKQAEAILIYCEERFGGN